MSHRITYILQIGYEDHGWSESECFTNKEEAEGAYWRLQDAFLDIRLVCRIENDVVANYNSLDEDGNNV